MQYTRKPAMEFSQPFFVAGPPNCMQFYPCFTSPPEPQNFPMYNGQTYNGPFQNVIGEGDISSVVLPDGTVQMFFIPAHPNNTGPWFIRSVNNPNLRSTLLPYGSPNYYNPNDRMALLPCPGFQPNQGVKFHNDRCTSTEDIGYFYPRMQQKYDEQSGVRDQPCCAGVVCHAPCKCPSNCVGVQPPIYQGFLGQDDSEMSVDNETRRGKKRKKRNVDCACVSSIDCQKNRKRQKREYSDSSSSESSDESYKERKKRKKACKKQCKKLKKERQKRRKQCEKEVKKLKEKECRKGKKHDAKKCACAKDSESCACTEKTDSCACSYDKQKRDTPAVCDTDPQSEACSSLLGRLGSAISSMISTCASSISTCSSRSTDICESSNSETKLDNEELRKQDVLTECEREKKKSRDAEKKRLEKEIKKLEAEDKKSEKELLKRIAKEQKLQKKEQKKREHEQRKRQKEKRLKQLSAEKTTCSSSASKKGKTSCSCKKPCCFEDPCSASLQNDYGKSDKDKHKTRSDYICPLSKHSYPSPYPCSPERQYSKGTRSDCCACGWASKEGSSLVNCSCKDSAMSIDTKNYSGDSETKCKRRDLKIIDISEDPCKDVGAYCKGPAMANKQTCGDALEVSQRNCGVLCEGPPTANKQSATHAVQSSCGVFANILDKLGGGAQCCSTAPPPCSTASSKVSFACDSDNHNTGTCAHRNPSCNPL